MGVDIHGPWVERFFTGRDGQERAWCVATIDAFTRDYAAFEIMASSAGSEWAIAPHRGIPSEPCWQWQHHLAEDLRRGVAHYRRTFKKYEVELPPPFDWQRCWKDGLWRTEEYGSCFGHSWLTTDEVEEAQRRYIRYYEQWRDDDPVTFADRGIAPYPGFTVAVATMRAAESVYDAPCRLVFCFDC